MKVVSKGNNNFSSTKQGRLPRDVLPPNYIEIRKTNSIIKSDELFNLKKPKNVKEYLKPFEDFPDWPSQEEIEVLRNYINYNNQNKILEIQ